MGSTSNLIAQFTVGNLSKLPAYKAPASPRFTTGTANMSSLSLWGTKAAVDVFGVTL